MENTADKNRDELETMRAELSSLHDALDRQKIVSESLFRKVVAGDSAWMNKFVKYETFLILPFSILIFLGMKFFLGTSWLFFALTSLMMIIDVVWDFRTLAIPQADFVRLPVIDLRKKIISAMRQRRIQMLVEVPLIVLWAIWLFFEVTSGKNIYTEIGAAWGFAIVLGIGLAFGLLCALLLFTKFQDSSRKQLRQLSEFENE